MKKMYMLEDLDCANCAAKMEEAISKIDGVTYARVSYLAQKLTLEADDARYDDILAEVVKTCKRVEPDDGYAFIMQASAPCMLSSMTDFYVTAAGLNITETTLAGFDQKTEKASGPHYRRGGTAGTGVVRSPAGGHLAAFGLLCAVFHCRLGCPVGCYPQDPAR